MTVPLPTDFNPAVHDRAPASHVELLAWKHRHSADFLVRQSAATILVASRLFQHLDGAQSPQRPLRRYAIARHARKLRALTRK